MRTRRLIAIAGFAGLGGLAFLAEGQQSVVDSVHNLSASGPGDVHAVGEDRVCIFCHTPHRSAASQPLWNRAAPVLPYTVYQSSALDAEPGQPTGASKMCLSCHDGSIALGSVLSSDQVITMAGAITTLPAGASNLGTDLSDDHPISFRFDARLATQDPHLADPAGLNPELRLDARQELQCTTCHDAHDNTFGAFLVMDNTNSTLCASCHRIADTTVEAHEHCSACHRTHSAPSGPFLLARDTVTDTCTDCHDGSVPRAGNVLADLHKISAHDTNPPADPDDRTAHTTCTDCHEPHSMLGDIPARAPDMAGNFGRVRTEDRPGRTTGSATYEYEVCFRCHGDENTSRVSPWITRAITQAGTRLSFDPGAASYHPVIAPGRNNDVPSLRAGWTEGSLVLCSDCHGSDTSRKAGGSGPNGVHGSNHAPLLLERYDTLDQTPESSAAYALCYRCHDRDGVNGILSDVSFPHSLHVVDNRTPCSACHDAHGVNSQQGNAFNNSHLINFDTSIVFPDPVTGLIQFEDRGRFAGSCNLTCHGVSHSPLVYD